MTDETDDNDVSKESVISKESAVSKESTTSEKIPSLLHSLLRSREKQRRILMYIVCGGATTFVLGWTGFVVYWLYKLSAVIFIPNKDVLVVLGGLWHILLILLLPPTSILLLLLRCVSFGSNASEFGGKPEKTSFSDMSSFSIVLGEAGKNIKEILEVVRNLSK